MGSAASEFQQQEIDRFDAPHSLQIDEALKRQQVGKVNKFQNSMFYCWVPSKVWPSTWHYFVTDKSQLLEFDESRGEVQICEDNYFKDPQLQVLVVKEFSCDADVRKRMVQVCGSRGHSWCLRNSEHLAKYIATGSWVSAQLFPSGNIMSVFNKYFTRETKKLVNVPPDDLKKIPDLRRPVYHLAKSFVKYLGSPSVLTEAAAKEAYNVVVLGPTGCGKSNLLNLCYNQTVCKSTGSALSVTRHMQITQGIAKSIHGRDNCPVNIMDSIGFCDSELSPQEVLSMIQQQVKAQFIHIDKVVMICSGRLESVQSDAMRQVMKWLKYEKYPLNFAIIYNKADLVPTDEREQALAEVCDKLMVSPQSLTFPSSQTVLLPSTIMKGCEGNPINTVENHVAVGFPHGVEYSLVENDHLIVVDTIFTTDPVKRIPLDTSTCAIL